MLHAPREGDRIISRFHLRGWSYICLALGILGGALTIRFTILTWDQPWPDPILTIDGRSYLKDALDATWGTIFNLNELYHSPGYQLYLRVLFAALGSIDAVIAASKLLSLLMFLASAWLLYRLSLRWFGAEVAYFAVAIFLLSESWRYYANMIQYEVLTGFLMLSYIALIVRADSAHVGRLTWLHDLGAGCILAFISLIQMRYLALLLIPLLYPVLTYGRSISLKAIRHRALIMVTTLTLLAAWSFAQSYIQGRTVVMMDGSQFRFHVANNPNAVGFAFPYPDIVEPSGWQFILTMPGQWLWLVGQRALYLLGIKHDVWALPPEEFASGRIGTYSVFDLVAMIVFAAGLLLAEYRCRRGELSDSYRMATLLVACVMLPPLLIFGSKRFIVPIVPFIAMFQSYAIVKIAQSLMGDEQLAT